MLAIGSKLRNTETFLHIRQLAEEGGVTLSEQMHQLVEFGLETVEDGKE